METTQYASEQSVKTNNQKVISKRARSRKQLACAAEETKLWLSPSTKQRRNPCSGHPLVYQDLSTRYDWPV